MAIVICIPSIERSKSTIKNHFSMKSLQQNTTFWTPQTTKEQQQEAKLALFRNIAKWKENANSKMYFFCISFENMGKINQVSFSYHLKASLDLPIPRSPKTIKRIGFHQVDWEFNHPKLWTIILIALDFQGHLFFFGYFSTTHFSVKLSAINKTPGSWLFLTSQTLKRDHDFTVKELL